MVSFPLTSEQANAYQNTLAQYLNIPVEFTNSLGMRFSYIPPGRFLMGSPLGESQRDDYETQHPVILTKGFYLADTPVTKNQFTRFARETAYKTEAENDGGIYYWTGKEYQKDPSKYWENPGINQADNHPVVGVSWNDCVAFTEWLTALESKNQSYRLPTEAEWEYACRAGTMTPFSFGETLSIDVANYNDYNNSGTGSKGKWYGQTTHVARFPSNAWKLYDMHGNVWEWCQDWYGIYPAVETIDYFGPSFGYYRILRGGSWEYQPTYCRSAFRFWHGPSSRHYNLGFRVCLPLD